MGSFSDWQAVISEEVDIHILVKRLSYRDEEVTKASREQATLFFEATKFRVQLQRKKKRLEARLKLLRSTLSGKIRRDLANQGNTRPTDKAVTEQVDRHPDVVDLERRLSDSEAAEEGSKLLLEAYRMRSSSFKTVTDMLGAEIYVQRRLENKDTSLVSIRDRLRDQLEAKYPAEKKKRKND